MPTGIQKGNLIFRSLALAVLGILSSTGQAQAQSSYVTMSGAGHEVTVNRIAPDIVQFTVLRDSYVRQLNSTAIITADDVVLFDSLTRPSSAAIVLEKLRAITRKPVSIVINSHAHPDHWSGTEVFARANPRLSVIASEQTNAFMHLMSPVWPKRIAGQVTDKRAQVAEEERTGELPDGNPASPQQIRLDRRDLHDLGTLADELAHLKRIYPGIIYKDRLLFSHGGKRFELTAMTGDQDGTSVLYLPDERVLLTGDLVSYPMPYLSAHPSRQLESLKTIDAMDFAVLVPGHGPAMRDHGFLQLEIALIEGAIAGVKRELVKGNGDIAAIQSHVTLDEFRSAFTHGDADLEQRYPARIKDLVRFAFQELTGSG